MKMGRGFKGFKKPKVDKGPKYTHAPEVEELAAKLINDHHSHLAEARIKYLFRNGKWQSKGKSTLGKAKLAAEDARFLGQYDFIIMISTDAWNSAVPAYREALVDHELQHLDCAEDKAGNKKWSIQDHDVQEFVSVVRRHGLWEVDLQKLIIAAKQGPYVDGPHNQIDMFHAGDKQQDGPGESPVN